MIIFRKAAKYDHKLRGKQFVVNTTLGLIALAVVYVISHLWLKPSSLLPNKVDVFAFLGSDDSDSAGCDRQTDPCDRPVNPHGTGILLIKDESSAIFYMGREIIEIFTEKVYRRNDEIDTLLQTSQATLIRNLGVLRRIVGSKTYDKLPILDALTDAIDAGKYEDALDIWRQIIREASPRNLDKLEAVPESILSSLIRLRQLKREQVQAYEGLAAPRLASVFWITTNLAIAEVIFWSLGGVLTNLLINSAKFLTEGTFRPIEKYVGYTKMVYGPMVSVVVVLAILIGWIDVGSYETVSWSLPVLGFLFGYNSRKTAMLVDRLSERILGAARKSIDEGPEAVAKRRMENLRSVMWNSRSPANFDELVTDAKIVAEAVVRRIVQDKEAAS